MAVFPTGVRKSTIFTGFTVCAHQARIVAYENYAFKGATSEILLLNFTAMELSYDALRPQFLFEDFDLTTKRSLAMDVCMLQSSGTQFVRGLPLFLLARGDEIMKCYFKPWPNGVASTRKLRALRAEAWHARSDDASDLSMPVSCQFQFSYKMQFLTLRDLAKVLHGNA